MLIRSTIGRPWSAMRVMRSVKSMRSTRSVALSASKKRRTFWIESRSSSRFLAASVNSCSLASGVKRRKAMLCAYRWPRSNWDISCSHAAFCATLLYPKDSGTASTTRFITVCRKKRGSRQ